MFECAICGLLSLNAVSCPACGSQNLRDLSATDGDDSDLPTEIPGLDEAADSWRDIEGDSLGDVHTSENHLESNQSETSLPFGFSGESNLQESRLPFGIGSHAEGIPFDNDAEDDEGDKVMSAPELVATPPVKQPEEATPEADHNELPEVIVKRPKAIRIQPLPESTQVDYSESQGNILPSSIDIPDSGVHEIPDEWRISALEADMEEIYSTEQEVVEVVHQYEDDIVVFDHKTSPGNSKLESSNELDVDILSLELHPARALDVDLSKNPECRDDLDAGYFAIAKNSWSEAAISFQKIAARMHGDSGVYNNYGLSLLQRAIEMAKDHDESVQMLAASQFESAILALREAAKSAPDEPVILLNLAHALLVSGRSEKALKIIEVHNKKHPNSVEGVNLEAATLVSLGQSINAKAKLSQYRGDSIVDENLARLL